jgi:hypothetical protein
LDILLFVSGVCEGDDSIAPEPFAVAALYSSRFEAKAEFAASAAIVVLVVCTRNSRRSDFKGEVPPVMCCLEGVSYRCSSITQSLAYGFLATSTYAAIAFKFLTKTALSMNSSP